jgi:hypothetical protein
MELLMKFTDETESFCNGVEFGRLLEKMQRGDENISNCNFPVKIKNKNVIEKACAEYGYIPSFGATSFDEWIEFTGIKKSFTLN